MLMFVFSSRRRHTRFDCDWSSDVCSSDLAGPRDVPVHLSGRVARARPGGGPRGDPRRAAPVRRACQRRAEAADGRLRPRRPNEDRSRPDRVARGRAGRRDARLPHRDARVESRLGALAGRDGPRSGRPRERAAPPGDASAAGPRGSRGLPQVRPPGRARHPGARERPGNGGPGGRRRGVQGAPGPVRRRNRLACGRIGRGQGRCRRAPGSGRGAACCAPTGTPESGRRCQSGALSGGRRRDGDDRPHRRGQGGGRHAGRRGRGDRAGPSRGPRLARLVGREAGRAAGAGAHVHPGGEGGGAGARLRGRAAQGLGGARRDPARPGPRHQPRGWDRRRHDHGGAVGRARRDEADLHADGAVAHRGPEDGRASPGAVGAVGCDGGACHGGHRRGDDGPGARAGAAREVRRRRAERDQAEFRGVPGTGAGPHAEGRGVVKRHIVLIGLPGSGKTTVGRLVAERLGAGFVDVDAIIERREGRPITLIFAEKGEAAFREMERKEMETALAAEPAVIAPGGGWAAQPGAIDSAKSHALVIYLYTRPETAAQRAGTAGTRPLLSGEDPVGRMRQLHKERESFYRNAHAPVGHLRDAPQRKLGVDVENAFTPEYVTIKEKAKTLAEIKKAAKASERVLLATDPDREGEAIAWHVASQLSNGGKVRRVLFHEITKDAVAHALAHPLDIDQRKVDAQQARRVLDRLVGYKTSPLLWKSIKTGLSAGRVQTVALRLICEREEEIRKFVPQEYWTIEADLEKDGQAFQARLHKLEGKKPEIKDEATARAIVADALKIPFTATTVEKGERRRAAPPPFRTSTLQQEAAKQLGFSAAVTMRIAQQLYEGIELGAEGPIGLITYMRTDSVRVADSAIAQARDYIGKEFGPRYLPAEPVVHKSGKSSSRVQDAHEAIRPTDVLRRPDDLKQHLDSKQFKLYQLHWRRFAASQMTPAVFQTTKVDFDLGRFVFRAAGSRVLFDGYPKLDHEPHEA